MADSTLDILIRTIAETQGVDKIQDALAKVKQGTKDTTEATHDAAESQRESNEATKEGSHLVETLHHNHRALHQILHMLGRETVPEFGHALGGLLLGPFGAIIALLAVFEALKKKLEEVREETEKVKKEITELKVENWLKQIELTNQAAEAMRHYRKSIEEAEAATKKLETAENQRLKVLNDQHEAMQKILDAQEKAELAAAQGDKEKEEEIKRRYGHKKTTEDLAYEQRQIDEAAKNAKDATEKTGHLKAESQNAADTHAKEMLDTGPTKELEKAKTKEQELAEKERVAREHYLGKSPEEYEKYISQLEKDLETAKENTKKGIFPTQDVNQVEHAQDALEGARSTFADYQKNGGKEFEENSRKIKELNAKVEERKQAIEAAADAMEKAQKAYTDNIAEVEKWTNKLKELNSTHSIHVETQKAVEAIGTTPEDVKRIVLNALKAIEDAKGGKYTPDDKHAMEELKALTGNVDMNFMALVRGLQASKDLHKAQASVVATIVKDLEALKKKADSIGK